MRRSRKMHSYEEYMDDFDSDVTWSMQEAVSEPLESNVNEYHEELQPKDPLGYRYMSEGKEKRKKKKKQRRENNQKLQRKSRDVSRPERSGLHKDVGYGLGLSRGFSLWRTLKDIRSCISKVSNPLTKVQRRSLRRKLSYYVDDLERIVVGVNPRAPTNDADEIISGDEEMREEVNALIEDALDEAALQGKIVQSDYFETRMSYVDQKCAMLKKQLEEMTSKKFVQDDVVSQKVEEQEKQEATRKKAQEQDKEEMMVNKVQEQDVQEVLEQDKEQMMAKKVQEQDVQEIMSKKDLEQDKEEMIVKKVQEQDMQEVMSQKVLEQDKEKMMAKKVQEQDGQEIMNKKELEQDKEEMMVKKVKGLKNFDAMGKKFQAQGNQESNGPKKRKSEEDAEEYVDMQQRGASRRQRVDPEHVLQGPAPLHASLCNLQAAVISQHSNGNLAKFLSEERDGDNGKRITSMGDAKGDQQIEEEETADVLGQMKDSSKAEDEELDESSRIQKEVTERPGNTPFKGWARPVGRPRGKGRGKGRAKAVPNILKRISLDY